MPLDTRCRRTPAWSTMLWALSLSCVTGIGRYRRGAVRYLSCPAFALTRRVVSSDAPPLSFPRAEPVPSRYVQDPRQHLIRKVPVVRLIFLNQHRRPLELGAGNPVRGINLPTDVQSLGKMILRNLVRSECASQHAQVHRHRSNGVGDDTHRPGHAREAAGRREGERHRALPAEHTLRLIRSWQ